MARASASPYAGRGVRHRLGTMAARRLATIAIPSGMNHASHGSIARFCGSAPGPADLANCATPTCSPTRLATEDVDSPVTPDRMPFLNAMT
jgi:hypothetical protein